MSRQSLRYKVVKYLSLILGALLIPFATYIGVLFGSEQYGLALLMLGLETSLALADSLMWCWVLEQMTGGLSSGNNIPN